MRLGWLWPFIEGILVGIFFIGAILAYKHKPLRIGGRLMAFSALFAFIAAVLFVFSSDMPDINSILVDWFESILEEVLGG